MLCKRIFQELLPLTAEANEFTSKFDDKVPSNIHLQLMKVGSDDLVMLSFFTSHINYFSQLQMMK